jgi:hypothetical protein
MLEKHILQNGLKARMMILEMMVAMMIGLMPN